MQIGVMARFDKVLADDPRMAAAMRRLPAAAWTADWPVAERAARAASNAAVRRALWHALRGLVLRLRAPDAATACDLPRPFFGLRDGTSRSRP